MVRFTIGAHKQKVFDGDRFVAWGKTEQDTQDICVGLNLLHITRLQAQMLGPVAPTNPTLAVHPPERQSIPIPAQPTAPRMTMDDMRQAQKPSGAADCGFAVLGGRS